MSSTRKTALLFGPTKVWTEYLQENKIIELDRKDYSNGLGMSWGKYIL